MPLNLEPEPVRRALEKAKGNVSAAAKKLGVSRQTLYNFLREHLEVWGTVTDSRAGRVDLAEDKLTTAIRKGEPWAITLTLKTLGKHLGYTDRMDSLVNATNFEAIKRIVARYKPEVDDEEVYLVIRNVQAEMDAERASLKG